ncbi:MAG: hypothetical protein ACRD5K_19600 [Candidatus Acidiferrales bacterium]
MVSRMSQAALAVALQFHDVSGDWSYVLWLLLLCAFVLAVLAFGYRGPKSWILKLNWFVLAIVSCPVIFLTLVLTRMNSLALAPMVGFALIELLARFGWQLIPALLVPSVVTAVAKDVPPRDRIVNLCISLNSILLISWYVYYQNRPERF